MDIPTHLSSITGPNFWIRQPRFFGNHLCLLSHYTIHQEYQMRKVSPLIKSGIQILAFIAPLMLVQEYMWLRPRIGVCIHVHHTDVKDTHLYGRPESKDTHIPRSSSPTSVSFA